MKSKLLIFFLALLYLGQAHSEIPQNWLGAWSGECTLTPAYMGIKNFEVTFQVELIQEKQSWTWVMINKFPNGNQEIRNYILNLIDKNKNKYEIDEQNGIRILSYISDNSLHSPFSINGRFIPSTYQFDKNKLTIRLPSYAVVSSQTKCLTGNPMLCAHSHELLRTQTCHLVRNP